MDERYLPLKEKELPTAPRSVSALGVGVVVMGLAIGTGELILWPHLIVKYGLGLLWMALVGITFQYFINQEVARHALATGESFFTSSSRLFKWFAPFWFFSAILLYVWPGWASALGTILAELFGFGSYVSWALICLLLVLMMTLSGRVAYIILEKSLKITVPTFFILLVFSSFNILSFENIKEAFWGLLNFGYIPNGIDIPTLMGAVVFAGAGGLLNTCISLWYRDKQFGMGKYAGRITNPISGKIESVSVSGFSFPINKQSISDWKKWMNFVRIDQGLIFWFLGLITLVLLSLNAFVVLTPKGLIPEGINVAIVQAHIFGEGWGVIGYNSFLIMAFLMLFSVMWTIVDAFTRIITDILYVNSNSGPFEKYLSFFKNVPESYLYYSLVVVILSSNAILMTFDQPLVLLTISAVLGGIAMAIYVPVLIFLNNFKLPKELRPGIITNVAMLLGAIFYITFSFVLIADKFGYY
ncbi:MAG: hypothetical protein UT05_C0009G0043 [Parcubacteria group bacterium GW2011_GWF2_38_76]|nr:MAG: hypothetical protein UT05_C0009G0043 [Parcubacteria group bacterium GW2011_GWF2_38_76]HBM45484.1 hypothetical protein [Patescibacteria group bacterium]